MGKDTELLTDLSLAELEALAHCTLVPSAQAKLGELLERKRDAALSVEDEAELDRLLQQTEQLTLLKTRARYTLSRTPTALAGT
jgi:hypothetical protein